VRPGFYIGCLALLATGCRHTTTSYSQVAPPHSAVYATMQRQVTNARYAGEGDPSRRKLQEQVAANPANLDARLALASLYEKSGHPELALEHYRFARTQKPDSEELLLRSVKAYEDLDLASKGIEELNAFLATHKHPAAVVSKLGILLDQQGEHQQAEAMHRRAVSLSPADSRLRNNLGYCLILQKRYPEAGAALREAVRLSPWSATARNNLALALALDPNVKDKRDAIAHWSSTSSPAAAHNNMAAAYIEIKDYQAAREEIANALSYQKEYAPALRNLQLISELDRGSASAQVKPIESSWRRFWAGVKGRLVKTEEIPGKSRAVAAR